MKFIPKLSLIFVFLFTSVTFAEPWVDTSNIFLRANIQLLADKGIITTPVTTYPLMWHDIARDINKVYLSQLDSNTQSALRYVKHHLLLAKRSQRTVSFNIANSEKRFTSFGEDFREKNNINLSTSMMTDVLAGKISTTYNQSPNDDKHVRFDGSYAAFFVGNWVLSAGMQNRWWGPSWDTSLSLTSNARPMPALALSRKSAIPVDIPFTDIKVPWTVTTFMGKMNDDRIVSNTLLWGFRLNFKPAKNWDVGITRLAQWGGDGREKSASIFLNVLKGMDNCGGNGPSVEQCAAGQEPGNQLAGYDIRWSTSIFNRPIAISYTIFAEDGDRKGGLNILGEERYQGAIETQVSLFSQQWKMYLEATDTYTSCKDGNNGDGTSTVGDCYYEHHIYQTGMRYKGRVISSIYDNDASSLVFGAISQTNNNTQYEFKLRWLQLNKDNHDKAPNNPLIGNTLTSVAEDMVMLSAKIQHSYQNWRFTLGCDVSQSHFDNPLPNDNDFNIFAKVEYNL